MRKPLSPLQAFAEDARIAAERAVDFGHDMVTWLSVAQTADQISALSGSGRDDALRDAGARLGPLATERPSMVHDGNPAPTSVVGQVAEQFRVAAESMEKAGCFELAYTTVAAVCRLTARADYVSAGLATVHLGRIAREMNDLSTAEDCYSAMLSKSMRERDGPLAARGHIGLALLHDMRGNLPAAEAGYLRALELAVPMGATCVLACQGLMSLAMSGNHLADALLYGWKLYDASEHDSETRAFALTDLAGVALKAGFVDAALRGFEHVINILHVPRVRMIAHAGALRALARSGNRSRAIQFDEAMLDDIAHANQPHTAAMVLLTAAEAWAEIGIGSRARLRLAESRRLSLKFGYNQYVFRADAILDKWNGASTAQAPIAKPTQLQSASRDPLVAVGIGRLEALSV